MKIKSRRKLPFFPIMIYLLFFILVFSPGISAADDNYVGVDTCRACHPTRYDSYLKSTHSKPAIPGNPANKYACESCHGPGLSHVQKAGARGTGLIAFVKKEDPYVKTGQCLSCHKDSRVVPFWDLSRHKANGVSCSDCHSGHSGTKYNLKATQPDLCYTCHLSVRAQMNKQSHHPVKEGLMKCSQCHDQHGGSGTKMIKADTANELCFKCHAEKRGPFLSEHPPVAENCLNCHVPHGSNHGKLLISKPPLLCQSCHDAAQHPGTIYTRFETFTGGAASGKNRMFARGCLNCHSNIHGSMGPSTRGQRFVR
ncbi:MAG TPA: DmsE family decaheme c-type cytochrome [Smithella sp.]|nr:DmsE family decaheme c-type cytochrome [Smithella sp.]